MSKRKGSLWTWILVSRGHSWELLLCSLPLHSRKRILNCVHSSFFDYSSEWSIEWKGHHVQALLWRWDFVGAENRSGKCEHDLWISSMQSHKQWNFLKAHILTPKQRSHDRSVQHVLLCIRILSGSLYPIAWCIKIISMRSIDGFGLLLVLLERISWASQNVTTKGKVATSQRKKTRHSNHRHHIKIQGTNSKIILK